MCHTENHILSMIEDLKSLLKVFSMFKIRIWYDDTLVTKNVQCAPFVKTIGFSLDNFSIENFITTFVTNMVFQNVG